MRRDNPINYYSRGAAAFLPCVLVHALVHTTEVSAHPATNSLYLPSQLTGTSFKIFTWPNRANCDT